VIIANLIFKKKKKTRFQYQTRLFPDITQSIHTHTPLFMTIANIIKSVFFNCESD